MPVSDRRYMRDPEPPPPRRRLSRFRLALWALVTLVLLAGGLAVQILAWLWAVLLFALFAGWVALVAARWLFPFDP